jgi:ABC-type sugar transport system ATPase subunit
MTRVFLDHITKVYGDKKKRVLAVNDLTLEIPEGTFVGLLGPSGCGKTTTLKIIAGFEKPTKGRIYFDDEDVTNWEPRRRNVAMIFQFPILYPTVTVYENIALPLKAAKFSESMIREEVRKAAEIIGITEYLNTKPPKLDLATRQKVILAKTLVRTPTIFLLDEPLTILDPKARVELRTKIKEIQIGLKKSMVYVTHDQTEVLTLAEKIAIMNEGKILQYDTPENIYNKPNNTFIAWFIGNPGMNHIECNVSKEGDKMYLITEGGFKYDVTFLANELEKLGPPQNVILGIRPEHVQIGIGGNMKAECIRIEHIGDRIILHLKLYDKILRAKTLTGITVKPGDIVPITLPKEKIMLFDATNGSLLI